MNRKSCLILLMLMLVLSIGSPAQNWSGVLAPKRAIDWSHAGAGTIPARTTICQAEKPGVSLAALNSDIASCPDGGVVYLNPGTYTFAGQITMKSNVTLRGAGADQTILKFTASGGCQGNGGDICVWNGDVGNPNYGANNQTTWTAKYTRGATTITLGAPVSKGSMGNLQVGSLLILGQKDQATDPGTIWNCASTGVTGACSQQGGGNGAPGASQTQTVTIRSITGSGPWTVGITPGLYSPVWAASHSPQAYWANFPPMTGVGIEDMTLDASAETDSHGVADALIFFGWATNSWVTGVRTLNTGNPPYRTNVWLYESTHITVQNNYFYGSNGSDLSYGVESGYETSDNLIANNIFQHVATPQIINGGQGIVYAYNYAADNYYTADNSSPGFQQVASYAGHQNGSYLNLFEGNSGGKFSGDDVHGTNWMTTAFRNWLPGPDGPFKTSSTMAVDIEAYDRYYNLLYNVLGTPGYHNSYQDIPASTKTCGSTGFGPPQTIYTLGWSSGNGYIYSAAALGCELVSGSFTIYNDLKVAKTLYRWGNYDTVNAATQWSTAEVPSALAAYAQPVPTAVCTASLACPASFYYSSQPAFWATAYGTPRWPAIGPDVTGGTGPGGHASAIPSQLCFDNALYDKHYAIKATISKVAESGTTATMTLASDAPPSFTQYQSFWIGGNWKYNELWQINSVAGNTITFIAPSGLGSANGGTAFVNAVRIFNAHDCYGTSAASRHPVPSGFFATQLRRRGYEAGSLAPGQPLPAQSINIE